MNFDRSIKAIHPDPRINLPQIFLVSFVSIIVVFLYSGYAYFALSQSGNPFKAVYFLYAALFVSAGCLLFARNHLILNRLPTGLFIVLFLFALINAAQLPFLNTNIVVFSAFEQRINWLLMIAVFIIILSKIDDLSPVIATLGVVLVVMCILNILEALAPWLLPYRPTHLIGRSAGFHEDPNISATFIACAIPLVCARLPLAARLGIYSLTLLGILFTVSRSGLLLWFLAVALSSMTSVKRTPQLTPATIVSFLVVGMIGLFLASVYQPIVVALADAIRPISGDVAARLTGQVDGSALERLYVLRFGWDAFLQNSIFGHGVGYTLRWGYAVGAHNMPLMMIVEYGLIGLFVLVMFVREVFRFAWPYGYWIGLLFALGSLFMHTYFDMANTALMFALYWAAGASRYGRQ